jgi:hypothetical protein
MLLGFGYGGWTTGDTARGLAQRQADTAVTAALVPVCIAQSKADRTAAKKIRELKALTSPYQRRDFVAGTGWATVPGGEGPDRDVAGACAAALLKTASNQ